MSLRLYLYKESLGFQLKRNIVYSKFIWEIILESKSLCFLRLDNHKKLQHELSKLDQNNRKFYPKKKNKETNNNKLS